MPVHVNATAERVMQVRAAVVLFAALALLSHVACLVAQHSIAVVEARRLLPRWDLATHLELGWFDYHFLVTGRIDRLLWDLWLQGYWPPVQSIYQIPFYVVLGGRMSAGLWSSLVAFVVAGTAGVSILLREPRTNGLLAAGVFLALLISSPYLLAYASVTMTETLGALMQLVVILCYVNYRQQPDPRTARAFVISLTALFFTKYNYFFLLVVPLAIHEWLERTSADNAAARLAGVARAARRVLSSLLAVLLVLYFAGLVILFRTGGFDFSLLGRRVSVHTIGNTGHIVLYVLLLRLWYLNRQGRLDWNSVASLDPRARPFLVWFLLPVTVWLASPYPNHIRDFANLIFNRPLGESTISAGVSTYVDVLRGSYFYSQWVLAAAIAAFCIAALRYGRQPPWMRWLLIAVPLQFAAIALHQTRFPRFLLLTVVLLCLLAACEAGAWFGRTRNRRITGAVLAAAVAIAGVRGAHAAVTQDRFTEVAFENYTDSASLRSALESIRGELTADDRLAIVGEGNELSPALFRWELGPPSGAACSPYRLGGADRLDPSLATRVLLMDPLASGPGTLDVTSYYIAQRRTVLERVNGGEFALEREIRLDDLQVALRFYKRTSKPERLISCE